MTVRSVQANPGPAAPAAPEARGLLQRCGPVPCDCPDEEKAQLRRTAVVAGPAGTPAVPRSVHEVLAAPGTPLPAATRAYFGPRFGHDFSAVRVHTGAGAADSARDVGALAYTIGTDIVLGAAAGPAIDEPGSPLLAHELTHVVQQQGTPALGTLTVGAADSPAEREAAAMSAWTTAARHAMAVRPAGMPRPGRVLQRQPVPVRPPGQQRLAQICEAPGAVPQRDANGCSHREPENCVTYERWLATFATLAHFTSGDTIPGGTPTGHEVLGGGPASAEAGAAEEERPPQPVGANVADRFIDHPTDEWVRTCLPENLRQTAYRLPADCADIAVILRHVWLSAHRRTERVGRWVLGDAAGRAAQARVGVVIGQVYSGNVAAMINPYADARGAPLRSFAALQSRLHPGDVLVWAHHRDGPEGARTGGHTQTIVRVVRQAGRVVELHVLQGNQPITDVQATEIKGQLRSEHPRRAVPAGVALTGAPGRRIEADVLDAPELTDVLLPPRGRRAAGAGQAVWTWSDGSTTLVAAGPPAAAVRPPAGRGGRAARRVTDWAGALRAADAGTLPGTVEPALLELRTETEAGNEPAEDDVVALGRVLGRRIRQLAGPGRGGGEQLRAVIRSIGGIAPSGPHDNPNAERTRQLFQRLLDAVDLAANERGGSRP